MLKKLVSLVVAPAAVFGLPLLVTKEGREFLTDVAVDACDAVSRGASFVRDKLTSDTPIDDDPEPEGEPDPATPEEEDAAAIHYAEDVLDELKTDVNPE